MRYFIIGDIHGCFHTFKNMLEKHWNHNEEILIQLGDLIDRGKKSPQMVEYARELHGNFSEKVFFLRGNHEFEMIEHFTKEPNHNWLRQCGEETLRQYEVANRDCESDVKWMKDLPLFWENDYLFISHAGIAEEASDPFLEDDEYSVIWNRSRLKNIGKLQIIGHTPCRNPSYDENSNSWNIDTAAAYSGYLTGVKIDSLGRVIEFVRGNTDLRDK
ncbi:metallophosphoesterase family protein [Bacillus suaedaesalsae]|uniref:Serine/threonine protein phosphatase n=1 Tax=Bacillus suaedaesalsae TaxID=2810349 RepID=A0ABS2DHQ6_9BACI|nr:metallophosphoesterase family protein [Bacillus suaedaesalsae]MBM6617941.1 serine/threonine protein phosphatase [Bacillus suaedaesalsae]